MESKSDLFTVHLPVCPVQTCTIYAIFSLSFTSCKQWAYSWTSLSLHSDLTVSDQDSLCSLLLLLCISYQISPTYSISFYIPALVVYLDSNPYFLFPLLKIPPGYPWQTRAPRPSVARGLFCNLWPKNISYNLKEKEEDEETGEFTT